MKPSILLLLAICMLCSCGRKRSNQNNDTPAVLETNKSFSESIKRVPTDLVDAIYDEIASETPELQELENQIQDVNDRKDDSLSVYEKFTGKNDQYYASAGHHFEVISDSSLKEKIKTLINNSQDNYKNSTGGLTDLVDQLDAKQATLKDYHQVLKLTRTLPIIEKYQKKNPPSKKPIAAVVNDYNRLIQKMDTLLKK